MKKFLIAASLFAIASIAQAAPKSEWTEVSRGGGAVYSVKSSSVRVVDNDANVRVVMGTIRIVTTATKTVDVHMLYVPMSQCGNGYGKLNMTDTTGVWEADMPFAIGSGNVASEIAEVLCLVGDALQSIKAAPANPKKTV